LKLRSNKVMGMEEEFKATFLAAMKIAAKGRGFTGCGKTVAAVILRSRRRRRISPVA
jgi:hypothetical protein